MVEGVFYGRDFISVTAAPGVSWTDLEPLVLETLLDHFVSGAPLFAPGSAAGIHVADDSDFEEDPADADIIDQIKELIETRVRPAVAQDGGDIAYKGYRDGHLYLSMHGACSGCPSSTVTLKRGIESLIRHYVPEVEIGRSRSNFQGVAAFAPHVPTIRPMILAFDTSSAACTAALFDDAAAASRARDEVIGRGHAERLVPMIAELMDGPRADRILVGVGPGASPASASRSPPRTGSRSAGAPSLTACRRWRCSPRARRPRRSRSGRDRRPWRTVRPAVRRRRRSSRRRSSATCRPAEAARRDHAPTRRRLRAHAARRRARLGRSARCLAVGGERAPACRRRCDRLLAKPVYARAPDARVPEAA